MKANKNIEESKNDKFLEHIQNVKDTCKRLNCTTYELLHMDYMKELEKTKNDIKR